MAIGKINKTLVRGSSRIKTKLCEIKINELFFGFRRPLAIMMTDWTFIPPRGKFIGELTRRSRRQPSKQFYVFVSTKLGENCALIEPSVFARFPRW